MKSTIKPQNAISKLLLAALFMLICSNSSNQVAYARSGAEMPFCNVSGGKSGLANLEDTVTRDCGQTGPGGQPGQGNLNAINVDSARGGKKSNKFVTKPMTEVAGKDEVGLLNSATAAEKYCGNDSASIEAHRDAVGGVWGKDVGGTLAVVSATQGAIDHLSTLRPMQNAMIGQGQAMGAATVAADVAGEIGHDMAQTAINYVAKSRENFTVDGTNKWNKIRDQIFVPIGLLLLLPGAVLAQVKAIMAAGNPVLGHVNPFDGILRALVAIFLIPGTYLICNYGIDLSNSFTYTISSEFSRLFGTNMYTDAICHEFKSMPWRLPEENRNTIDIPISSMGIPLMGNETPFAQLEATLIAVKIYDPCSGIYLVPPDRANEAVPASCMAARMATNSSNAALCTSWSILCAFQMAYFYYLWCVGPVVAGLWVWPMKQLRDALPAWIEGVIVVCFWSFFWNTVVLLMAAFRGVDETGTFVMLALNTLANISVKFAFDFGGLVRSAGGEAIKLGEKLSKAVQNSGSGGGGGGGGGGGDCGGGGDSSAAPTAPGQNNAQSAPQRPNIAMRESSTNVSLASSGPSANPASNPSTSINTRINHANAQLDATFGKPTNSPAPTQSVATGQQAPIRNLSPKTPPPPGANVDHAKHKKELLQAGALIALNARDAEIKRKNGGTMPSPSDVFKGLHDPSTAAGRHQMVSSMMHEAATPERAHIQGAPRNFPHSADQSETDNFQKELMDQYRQFRTEPTINDLINASKALVITASTEFTPPTSSAQRNQTVSEMTRSAARPEQYINQH